MAVGYIPLPAFRAPGPLDFSGLDNALSDLGARNERDRERNRLLRKEETELAERKGVGAALTGQTTGESPYQAQPTNRLMSPAMGSAGAAGREMPQPGMGQYSSAISSIESGGRYNEVGPTTRTGDRAFGKYQVMGANVGPWTREILGREMTPQEFLADKDAQEKVFSGKFGQYVQKTGNPQDAASMWFTGRPQAQGAGRRDILGTTGSEYVRRFNAALPQGAGQQMGGATAPAAVSQSPAPSSLNYAAGIRMALSQGNTALAMQLQNAQQEAEATSYNRGRQGVQDQQSAETHRLTVEKAEEERDARFTKRVGAASQTIRNERDPARRQTMWNTMVSMHPGFAATLRKLGVSDVNDVDAGTQALIAEARGMQPAKRPIELAPGGTLVDPDSYKPVYTAPSKPLASPVPSGYRYGEDGSKLEFIPGGPADPAVKPKGRDKYTEVQTKAANFGNMMVNAEAELAKGAGVGPDGKPLPVTNPKNILGAARDGLVPVEALRNAMRPDETQAYEQAAKQWIRAKLRKESGAAIGKDEMEAEFQTYFPQYWDGPETVARKARARTEATKGMIAESNGAYGQLFQGVPGSGNDASEPAPDVSAASTGRPRAVNPDTGETVEFNEQSGQWEPVQ